jgi:hypothetical protein
MLKENRTVQAIKSPRPKQAEWSWVLRPQVAEDGWAAAILRIGEKYYAASGFWVTNPDSGHHWHVVDLRRGDVHYRLTLGPDGEHCDCADATYREHACKHVSAVREALEEQEQYERLQWESDVAKADLRLHETTPPF